MYMKNTMHKELTNFSSLDLYNKLKWYLFSLILGILDLKSTVHFQLPNQNFLFSKFVCPIFAIIICPLPGIFQYNLLLSLTFGEIAKLNVQILLWKGPYEFSTLHGSKGSMSQA